MCTCWMKSSDALSELELQLAAAAGAGARALFSAFADISGAAAGDAIGDGAIASIKDPVASTGAAKVGTAFVYLLQMQQSSQNCLSCLEALSASGADGLLQYNQVHAWA